MRERKREKESSEERENGGINLALIREFGGIVAILFIPPSRITRAHRSFR